MFVGRCNFTNGNVEADDSSQPDMVVPAFGYRFCMAMNVRHDLVHRQIVSNATAHVDARLREGLVNRANTSPSAWADMAYRSEAN